MLIIHDEKVATLVRDIAAREQRPIEQVVEAMATQYARAAAPTVDKLARLRARFYQMARDYWLAENNTERLTMTEAEFDAQLAYFDENGMPLLKHEVSQDKENHSLAALAQQHGFNSGQPDLAARTREIAAAEMGQDSYERYSQKDA